MSEPAPAANPPRGLRMGDEVRTRTPNLAPRPSSEPSEFSEPTLIWVSDPNLANDSEGIDGFYRTREGAVRGVKGRFGEPYKVRWSEQASSATGLLLRGEFDAVPGYSTKHVAEWFILPVAVEP